MIARRVQVTGDRFHPVIPAGAVWIGRPAPYRPGSPFANPFPLRVYTRELSLRLYGEHLDAHPELVVRAVRELAERDLACVCGPEDDCHVDVLLERMAALVGRVAEGMLAA